MVEVGNSYILGVPPYVFFIGLGLIASSLVYTYLMTHARIILGPKYIVFLGLGCVGAYYGARIFGVLTCIVNSLTARQKIGIDVIRNAGLVYYGGLLLGTAFYILLEKIFFNRKDGKLINILAVAIPAFHAFGRLGCLFAGCCYGKEWDSPYGITYIHQGVQTTRFPIQLIESIAEVFFFIILFNLYLHGKNEKQNLLRCYLAMYSSIRFILEYFRGDTSRGHIGMLSFSQCISIILLIALAATSTKYKKERTGGREWRFLGMH